MSSEDPATPLLAPPLHLTIRFSTSIPDLDLDVASPRDTTVLALKNTLRKRISSRHRLRLIHQGRLLPDSSALSSVLRAIPPPPSAKSTSYDDGGARDKGKGKEVERAARTYVNCSIGDELSPEGLAQEDADATKPPDSAAGDQVKPTTSVRPRPRGFDRLLQAGFSASEVSTLRTQFASINSDRFSADSPPSPDALRGLEDAWIDSNAGEVPSMATGMGTTLEDDITGMATVLDVLIRGMMVGFFFPLGSVAWLLRLGIWGEKWHIFVGSGVVLSIMVGLIMAISRD